MRPQHFEIMLAPGDKVANRHLLDYWRPHLRTITSPLLCEVLAEFSRGSKLDYDVVGYTFSSKGTIRHPSIQRAYADRPPLLSLSESDRERGWACLRKLGVPEGAWFVCVHCREYGYWKWEDNRHRDADINSYLLAIKTIVEQGGWVIRMGDPTVKPLPQMEQVIDYARLSIKSDWMDVFLCGSCKFFLGSSSGLCTVASTFGVPLALAHLIPIPTLPCGFSDLGIPKLLWSSREGRYLTFKEVFDSPVGGFFRMDEYVAAGLKVVDNSAEEINDLTLEILDRLEGKAVYTVEDEQLQARYKSLFRPGHYSFGSPSRVSRDFLRKYKMLLPD